MASRPCKFGPNCNKFQSGQDCGFKHDSQMSGQSNFINPNQPKTQICKFGNKCNKAKLGTCTFLHQEIMGQEFQQPMLQATKALCKFGDNCNNWKQGKCTYPHPYPYAGQIQGQVQGQGQMAQTKGACKFGDTCKFFALGKCPFNHNIQQQQIPIQQNQQFYNQGNLKSGDIQNLICRNFSYGNCTNNNCKRLHKFSANGAIQRMFFDNSFPTSKNSDMALLKNQNGNYVVLKLKNDIHFLFFDYQSSTLKRQNFTYSVPQNLNLFKIQGNCLIYSYQNPTSKFENLSIFNIVKNNQIKISNAHTKAITGAIFINQTNMITVSKDSLIKAWLLNNNNEFQLNKEGCQKFQSGIQGKPQFNFCKFTVASGNQLICAGTNDGKIYIWILATMKLLVATTAPYTNVLDLEFKLFGGSTIGIILVGNKSSSALLTLNLQNFGVNAIISDDNNPITSMVLTNDMLFLCHMKSNMSIYSVPNLQKIGFVFSNNQITSVLYTENVTSTAITFRNIIIMEQIRENAKDDKGKGSVSIFRISQ